MALLHAPDEPRAKQRGASGFLGDGDEERGSTFDQLANERAGDAGVDARHEVSSHAGPDGSGRLGSGGQYPQAHAGLVEQIGADIGVHRVRKIGHDSGAYSTGTCSGTGRRSRQEPSSSVQPVQGNPGSAQWVSLVLLRALKYSPHHAPSQRRPSSPASLRLDRVRRNRLLRRRRYSPEQRKTLHVRCGPGCRLGDRKRRHHRDGPVLRAARGLPRWLPREPDLLARHLRDAERMHEQRRLPLRHVLRAGHRLRAVGIAA